eukprot:SAG22_NODE_1111_length_5537_cov_6.209636_4_plen_83_part_00
MLGVGAVPPALVLLLLCLMPESPRWLVARGREADAARVLHLVCGPAEARHSLEIMKAEVCPLRCAALSATLTPNQCYYLKVV